jgi:hypothetical protein
MKNLFTNREQAELLFINSMDQMLYDNVMQLLYGNADNDDQEEYFISACHELNFD